ncbi:transcription termination factor MTERF5 [Cucumis melo var. makuwa]|uniref:Transcription termination factor MTERF5 n=2 Tax=Cucumis melo TaxID=3656 RepID=A0A5A7V906_CUCMM|nr:transcription termination factor MTERF5 [Cucumis melo var. makuwa]
MANSLLKPSLLRPFAQDLRNFTHNNTTIGLKFLSSLSQTPQSTNDRTQDYLVHTIGLPKDSALAAAKKIRLKPTADPDSVLALFNAYGFTPSHIASIFSKQSCLLLADPDTTLKPKIEFLSKNGISGNLLADVICRDPHILHRSLDKQIVPCIDFLINFFGSTDGVVLLFSAGGGTRVLETFSESMAPNVEVLRANGVPDSNIAKMLSLRPIALSKDVEHFIDIVEKTKEMGLNPSSLMFIHGMCMIASMSKDKWLSKVHLFKSFGWSDEQFQSMFLKQPFFMKRSEEHLKRMLDFFMNKWDWTLEDVSKYPVLLNLSLEKRVIPRSSIVQRLISKGFIKRKSFGKALQRPEQWFLEKFVMKYLSEDPHLLEMYQETKKKMAIQ